QWAHADAQPGELLGLKRGLDALQAVVPTSGAFAAQAERARWDPKFIHEDQEVGRRIEGGIGAERCQGRAARVHVGGRLEDTNARAVPDLTLTHTRALAAAKGGKAPVRDERFGQPVARVVTRRRVFWPRIAEADHGAQASALFAALGLLRLVGLRGRRSRSAFGIGLWRPPPSPTLGCGLAFLFFALAHLADEL